MVTEADAPGRSTEVTCVVCGGSTGLTRVGAVGFAACTDCGYARLLEDGRGERYWDGRTEVHDFDSVWGASKQRLFVNALERLERLSPGRTLCDVGGGAGYFAEVARGRGWAAQVVEISDAARTLAAIRLGSSSVHRAVSEVPEPVDVATMWCVIAHVGDPLRLVEETATRLRPGGWLFLTTPNWHFQRIGGRVLARIGKPIAFARQDHVGQFTRRAVTRLLEAAGFETPVFAYCGVTERCCALGRNDPSVLAAKKLWNRAWVGAGKLGLPELTSELHVFARRRA
jgi:SAM-dependent methyltransferase